MFKKLKDKFTNYTKRDWLKAAYHMFLLTLGNFILAFGTGGFLVPYKIITGGVSGIAIVLDEILTPLFGVSSLADVYIWLLVVILFFVGLLFLGWDFSAKTLFSVIIYPFFNTLIMRVMKPENWIVFNNTSESFTTFLVCIVGSTFVGLGCAVAYKGGGSTGGVDVITFIVQKYLKIKASITSFIIDSSIILCGLIVYKDLNMTIIGIMGAFVCSLMIEKVFIGASGTYVAEIVSDKWQEINDFILNKMERGSTIVHSEGGYTGDEKRMIKVAFDRHEYTELLDYISKVDKNAFVTVTLIHEANGLGFKSFPKKKL